jgi:hypothetical protein
MNESKPEGEKKIGNIENVISKEAVVISLKQNPKDITLLGSYINKKREQSQAPYLSHEDARRKTLEFAIELAEIYRDSGLIEQAAEAYNDAADMAQANGMEEEYGAILVELAKI